jgi:hypothetical protein
LIAGQMPVKKRRQVVLKEKNAALIAIHNDRIFWLSTAQADMGRCLFQLPLETVMDDGIEMSSFPESLKGNNKFLCLVPDHWFGMESYPFKSQKPSLIEPFLKRKLSSSHPDQNAISQFFNYIYHPANGTSDNLYAYFLHDEKAYRINRALRKANLAPLGFTTPAFLWEDKLKKTSNLFNQDGSLLVHMCDQECRLCFYFNGSYLFSRSVVLPDDGERIGAITYEINQSLYLFSQKTKSELKQIYLLAAEPSFGEALSEALGRELIDCDALLPASQNNLAIPEVPFLSRLLVKGHLTKRTPVFSVMHRQVKRHLEWKPVQMTGIAVGLVLVILLVCEAIFLSSMRRTAEDDHRVLQKQMRASNDVVLTDYEVAFEQVMQRIDRPSCADTVLLTMTSLPANVWLKELDMDVASSPAVKVTALVDARDTDHLRRTLTQLVTKVKTTFKNTPALSINDIDVESTSGDDHQTAFRFKIVFRLELV